MMQKNLEKMIETLVHFNGLGTLSTVISLQVNHCIILLGGGSFGIYKIRLLSSKAQGQKYF